LSQTLICESERAIGSTSENAKFPTPSHYVHLCRLVCSGATDKGLERAHNEDRFGAFPEVGLFVVSDGMGGAAAGEVAAHMAIEHLHGAVAKADASWVIPVTASGQVGLRRLVAGIEHANHEVYTASLSRPELRGMGTTIAALLACGDRAAIAHVGDSRVYRLRGRTLDQLTEDHSWLNELVRRGVLDPERADRFEHRNVITRAVGTAPTVEVDARLVDVAPGDTLLLCSDGLSGVLSRGELTEILIANLDLDRAVERLIDKANQLGGPDNITAIAVRWEATEVLARARG